MEKGKIFKPPTREEFVAYCADHGFSHVGNRAYDYYVAGEWHDKYGDPIRNWKQKLISVWFDLNRNPVPKSEYRPAQAVKYQPLPEVVEHDATKEDLGAFARSMYQNLLKKKEVVQLTQEEILERKQAAQRQLEEMMANAASNKN